ncbi:MAG TPA: hypothetical protein VLC55_00735 [Burkholderiales bacterium]|nr:hypothetical protein [Burkholderiales bacterium]
MSGVRTLGERRPLGLLGEEQEEVWRRAGHLIRRSCSDQVRLERRQGSRAAVVAEDFVPCCARQRRLSVVRIVRHVVMRIAMEVGV